MELEWKGLYCHRPIPDSDSNPNLRHSRLASSSFFPAFSASVFHRLRSVMIEHTTAYQLSLPNQQMAQLEPTSNNLDSSMPNMQMGQIRTLPNDHGLQHLSVSSKQMELLEPISCTHMPPMIPVSSKQLGQMEPRANNLVAQQSLMPNRQLEVVDSNSNNFGLQQSSTPNKRKVPMEPISNSPGAQQISMPNKRVAQMEHRPWLQQLFVPNKKIPVQVAPNTPGSQHLTVPNKKMVRTDSMSRKSAPQQVVTPKGQTTQMQPSPKVRSESFESVRTKLRESLADALALVYQQQDKPPHMEKNSKNEATNTSIPRQSQEDSEPAESASTANWKYDRQEFQLNTVLPDAESSFSDNFFVKDELLQGNGLSWALDLDTEVVNEGQKTVQSPQTLAFEIEAELFKLFGGVNKKYKEKGRSLLFNLKDRNNPELRERVVAGEISPERLCSMTAEELASKELSEWRIAKAEELAQMVVLPDSEVDIRRLVRKTHKGEFQVEFEQDDGASVEVSVGTSSLTRVRPRTKEKEARRPSEPDGTKSKTNLIEEKDPDLMQGLMGDEFKDEEFLPPIVSLDEFMQSLDSEPPFENLPVDAEKVTPASGKDNSGVNVSPKGPDSTLNKPDKMHEKDAKSDANEKPNDGHVQSETSLPGGTSKSNEKSSHVHMQSESAPHVDQKKGDYVWEGLLQLNVSSMATVVCFFKSGEKASTKEWPGFLEIKGRVRLDAFEKFLQELPMSRSRATMVVRFAWKEGSSEDGRANLCEVADSYVLDERVGFAEPAPGMELYFCPPHTRTLEMISKHLYKDQTETLNSTDNGLIGVVVWRKAQLTSTISPNSSSLHKHGTKKQHFSTRRHHEKDANMNSNFTSKPSHPLGSAPNIPEPSTDDDDDIPPGFGPAASRDEDDLPEFQFSGGSNSSTAPFSARTTPGGPGVAPFNQPPHNSPRPVEQMRQLIQKYGQSRIIGHVTQPWADDDDDDIPEWQPQAPQQQLQPPQPTPPVYGFQAQPVLPTHMQQHLGAAQPQQPLGPLPTPLSMTLQSLQSSVNLVQAPQNPPTPSWQQQQQQGSWWVPPSGPQGLPSVQGNAPYPGTGQTGINWRQDVPRSRGF
ncbi:unnamed protein product, partial [Vitis vinifera]